MSGSRRSGLAVLALIVAIGWIDARTGLTFGFSLFYLIPIGWTAWRLGWRWSAAMVLTAAGSWIAADVAARPDPHYAAVTWNSFTRLVIYGAVAWMVVRLREDRERLEQMNQALSDALGAQTALASIDPLTELPNSRTFARELERRLRESHPTGQPVCLAYVDLDNFKELNDNYGHLAGDEALRRVAEVLRGAIRSASPEREGDLAARLAGDEFAILFSGVDGAAAAAIARRVIERIAALGAEYPAARLGASAGISCSLLADGGAEELIRRADRAMYRSKEEGKGKVVIEAAGERSGARPG